MGRPETGRRSEEDHSRGVGQLSRRREMGDTLTRASRCLTVKQTVRPRAAGAVAAHKVGCYSSVMPVTHRSKGPGGGQFMPGKRADTKVASDDSLDVNTFVSDGDERRATIRRAELDAARNPDLDITPLGRRTMTAGQSSGASGQFGPSRRERRRHDTGGQFGPGPGGEGSINAEVAPSNALPQLPTEGQFSPEPGLPPEEEPSSQAPRRRLGKRPPPEERRRRSPRIGLPGTAKEPSGEPGGKQAAAETFGAIDECVALADSGHPDAAQTAFKALVDTNPQALDHAYATSPKRFTESYNRISDPHRLGRETLK